MKVCIVGLGQNPIPPLGWGAVEILIGDYKIALESIGHEVVIINTPNRREIVEKCNSENPDFVHIHYDLFWDICEDLDCDNVAITSHYGYLDQENKYDQGYKEVFQGFLSLKKARIFSLSEKNLTKYTESGFDPNRIVLACNGVRDDIFRFSEICEYPGRSIYLAKIEPRKRQNIFHDIPDLYFAGNISDPSYNKKNYLGEWTKDSVYNDLTRYSNLVLLSDGEAHPLVCMEAMTAGLGLVISEWATANLDLNLPFIDVIPESRINDTDYVSRVISNNRIKSIASRKQIRDYAIQNFSWSGIIAKYIKSIQINK